jgi:hypothetical protein
MGSTAVLNAIEKHQPLLGLHGHIHESRAIQQIGRTLCINPGSQYTKGILGGVVIFFKKDRIKDYMFVSGSPRSGVDAGAILSRDPTESRQPERGRQDGKREGIASGSLQTAL